VRQLREYFLQWFHKVVVFQRAAGAAYQTAIVTKELKRAGRVAERLTTSVTRETQRAARHRGEDVVRVHGSDDERLPGPRRTTRAADQRCTLSSERTARIHAAHADCVHKHRAVAALGASVVAVDGGTDA